MSGGFHAPDSPLPPHVSPLLNAELQLLVYCPPFRDLFKDLGWLLDQREGGETTRGATPLIDATIRFMDEFSYKKSSPAHQLLKQAESGKVEENEDGKREDDGVHPFLSTYLYDAIKEKRLFINWVRYCMYVLAFCH